MEPNKSKPKRTVTRITGAAAGGGALGAALAEVIVWAYPPAEPIEAAVSVIVVAVLGVIGGWIVRSRPDGKHEAN